MANTKSARKRAEKSEKQRLINRAARSRVRTAVRKAREAAAVGAADAGAKVAEAAAILDASARKGLLHQNTAARTKSRLTKAARAANR
jgi:small subunit ribosomal protein S20